MNNPVRKTATDKTIDTMAIVKDQPYAKAFILSLVHFLSRWKMATAAQVNTP